LLPAAAEPLSFGHGGWIGLDAQHGFYDDRAIRQAMHVISPATDVIVRVPENDPAWIGRVLDTGARGVIVPMIEDAEQAARAAEATRFPPAGHRSWGQFAEHWGRVERTVAEANAYAVCAVMVETRKGLDNVDAIAAVPGIDMIYVGPFDLSIALGLSIEDLLAGDGSELATITAACHDHDVIPGAFAGTSARTAMLTGLGFEVLAAITDRQILTDGAAALKPKETSKDASAAHPSMNLDY